MDGCGASTLSALRQQNAIDTDTDDVGVVSQLPTKGNSILIFLLVISKPLGLGFTEVKPGVQYKLILV